MSVKTILSHWTIFALISGLCVTISPLAAAQSSAVYTPWNSNVAIDGYDAVSFFSGTPVSGTAEYTSLYQGASWAFSTQSNLDLFLAEPEKYAPQYGGYCAWAVAMNKLAKGDPEIWSVVDDKLYLNFNARIQTKWEQDSENLILKASERWPAILN